QVAAALNLAAETAQREGLQYLVTINSDDLAKAERRGFDPTPYILRQRLTDSDDGGLFGFRFSRSRTAPLLVVPERWSGLQGRLAIRRSRPRARSAGASPTPPDRTSRSTVRPGGTGPGQSKAPPASVAADRRGLVRWSGGCGIRTHEDGATALAVFKTAAIGH